MVCLGLGCWWGRGGDEAELTLLAEMMTILSSGKIHLLGHLDFEVKRLYRLIVLLVDYGQDQHSDHHRTGSCTITIEVEVIGLCSL